VDFGTTQTDDLTIEANAVGAIYQWLDCDDNYSIITGETSQSFIASINGSYVVEVTQNGCVDTSACTAITNVGLMENDFGKSLVVYPNPTSGVVTIKLFDEVYNLVNVRLSNAFGQEISTNSYSKIDHFEVEISGVPGVYFIEIKTSEGTKAKIKILKQ
jgi:hypothetical protein